MRSDSSLFIQRFHSQRNQKGHDGDNNCFYENFVATVQGAGTNNSAGSNTALERDDPAPSSYFAGDCPPNDTGNWNKQWWNQNARDKIRRNADHRLFVPSRRLESGFGKTFPLAFFSFPFLPSNFFFSYFCFFLFSFLLSVQNYPNYYYYCFGSCFSLTWWWGGNRQREMARSLRWRHTSQWKRYILGWFHLCIPSWTLKI